jgi:uncharacterized protein DUF6152
MTRGFIGSAICALVLLGVASSAAAHHRPRFDRCQLVTVTGQIERVDWVNPHVRVAVKGDDGMIYDLMWLNLQQLRLAGVQQDALKVGDAVVIKGSTQSEDATHMAMLLTEIHSPRSGLEWSHPPQGC